MRGATCSFIPMSLCLTLACADSERQVEVTRSALALALECTAISAQSLELSGLHELRAESVAAKYDGATASENHPAHCMVTGKLNPRTGQDGKPYAISFELRLPEHWNRRFFFQGGGGSDGFILPATGLIPGGFKVSNGLSRGYAVVSMDGGHTAEDLPLFIGMSSFGLDPEARSDYGYRALETVTSAAKQMVERVYGAAIERSYFVGCSNGGRQALVAASRYPDIFDGIVAGNPGFQLPKAALQHAWDYQQLLRIDASNPADALRAQEMKLVGERIASKCDALDGVSDGIVENGEDCRAAFDLDEDVPTCTTAARSGECLSALQKDVLKNLLAGPVNSRGEALYSDWPVDPSIGSDDVMGYRGWKLGMPDLFGLSLITTGGAGSLAYIFTTPPTDLAMQPAAALDPLAVLQDYLARFDFDRDAPKIHASTAQYSESAISFMTPPDETLRDFAATGHKLIVYHGTGDPVFSSNDTLRWYERLADAHTDAARFAKLFLVPGMTHCGGGPATDSFDMLSAVEDWVEQDRAPSAVVARIDPGNTSVPASWPLTRTRLLCPHPQHARLSPGASDTESAASFECAKP